MRERDKERGIREGRRNDTRKRRVTLTLVALEGGGGVHELGELVRVHHVIRIDNVLEPRWGLFHTLKPRLLVSILLPPLMGGNARQEKKNSER